MAPEAVQTGLFGRSQEGRRQGLVREGKDHIHIGAAGFDNRILIERAGVDQIIEPGGLLPGPSLHLARPALGLDPVEHQAGHVPVKGRRGVEHAAGLGLEAVIQQIGRARPGFGQEAGLDDHDSQPGRGDIFLRAGDDHAKAGDIDLLRQDGRGHVCGQHAGDLRHGLKFKAADRLIVAVITVGRVRVQAPFCAGGDGRKAGRLGGTGDIDPAIGPGHPQRPARPVPGVQIVGPGLARRQVHGQGRELLRGAAGQKQHVIIGRDRQQLAQGGLGMFGDGPEFRAAVADLHDRFAARLPVDEFGLGLAHDFRGQQGRPRGKIDHGRGHRPAAQAPRLGGKPCQREARALIPARPGVQRSAPDPQAAPSRPD